MSLTVATENDGEWTLLRVAGDIDLVSGAAIREHVHHQVAEGRRRLVLDLGGVRFCDSTGVGVLIAARRLLRSCAGELRLVLPDGAGGGEPSPGPAAPPAGGHVHRVFTALGVRRLFDIHPDVRSATRPSAAGSSAMGSSPTGLPATELPAQAGAAVPAAADPAIASGPAETTADRGRTERTAAGSAAPEARPLPV